ncbi:hypothetical protein K6Q96_00335 [Grimontia kaedaensis]|uniref:Lipoprotein n=1 Tax=Grimontia kaedaensis TaxID=2872157 RepID=A0ABY4WSI0_9GAMM|nr:hypothetical protein [Grimontia kaedaensis]USH02531.1 hypothetical protein K6Q96_00335 [Grimontia kaedaensis]
MIIQKRRLSHVLGPLSAAALLSACSQTPSGPVELGNSDDLNPQQEIAKVAGIQPQRFMLRGEVTLGHEVRAITPCGSNTQYWLQLPDLLNKEGQALTMEPYQSVYGEVIGEFVKPAMDGFAADYPATFKVTQLNLMSAEIDGCNQTRNRTVASGNEPFWSVSLEGNTLNYQQLGYEAKTFTLTSRDISPQARNYQANGATLTLNPELCNDTMSDSIYGWRSTFAKSNKTLTGCATLSADDPTLGWVGDYQGMTNLGGQSLTTTLVLNPDHTATTRYEQAGEDAVVETGIWQQVSDSKVQVMMTRHQGQYLVSERLFTRSGFTLKAEKEIINGREYSLGPEGLALSLMVGNQQPFISDGVEGSATFNEKVDAAFKAYLGEEGVKQASGTRYRWLTQDLNGDLQDELMIFTNWCGTGGCTLLVFNNDSNVWRFNSRITLVHLPFQMSQSTSNGWQDLIMPVGGGGAKASSRVLEFNGKRYPGNPSVAPEVLLPDSADPYLFADGIYPQQEGVELK